MISGSIQIQRNRPGGLIAVSHLSKIGMVRASIRIVLPFILTAVLYPAAAAQAIESFPGSTWGILTDSSSKINGSGGMGWINQGIDWCTLPGDVVLNTYAEYRHRARSREPEYYNAQGPALGLEFKKSFLRLGADFYWEYLPKYPDGAERSTIREYYLAGYYPWDLTTGIAGIHLPGSIGLPGGIWFNISHDINGLTGSGGMGWINQGIDWFTLPGNVVLNTYAEYRYRERTKLKDYYDVRGPAVGLEFKKSLFRIGADYYWQYYPVLEESARGLEFYLTWYVDWDLKKKEE